MILEHWYISIVGMILGIVLAYIWYKKKWYEDLNIGALIICFVFLISFISNAYCYENAITIKDIKYDDQVLCVTVKKSLSEGYWNLFEDSIFLTVEVYKDGESLYEKTEKFHWNYGRIHFYLNKDLDIGEYKIVASRGLFSDSEIFVVE